ncbi:FAD/NAD(P)-binding protein [Prauserella cavernicola]|uniref:FAD/NAD(P)-binding protein n=1 Tax=Prauserella cavernicola TaxID=2800127 RepID=A0A934QN17_9PSEU|nr:FAD/NAD(P)-binding protein [Prauserella cavernicola]MBK1783180.1 FAD/NAD(P)-binding protein [Prauserella cavernicola]
MTPFQLAIVGAGPRGVCVLERISANAPEFLGGRDLVVHLVDPFPPGPGRIWRHEQSPLLRMNSMAEDVTMFTDDTVRMKGPIRQGPSLAEWANLVRAGELEVEVPPDVAAELHALEGMSFPTRRLQSVYLAWVYEQILAGLPAGVEVREHRARATGITGESAQQVWLEGRDEPLHADATLLAVGHLDAEAHGTPEVLTRFATRRARRYYPPGYTADVDYSGVPAAEPVLVRGFGLAFVDLMLLLTEGRGGRFEEVPGGLRYEPSGAEPILHVGSRRGVPYHSKLGYRLRGAAPRLPRFFDDDAVSGLLARPGLLDFRADVWPLAAKEIAWGYYHELFTAHPERVRMSLAEFERAFAGQDWGSAGHRALVRHAVPAYDDRLDLDRLDRPLAGLRFDTAEAFGKHVRGYVEADLARRANPFFSADLGAFTALLSVYGRLAAMLGEGRIEGRSQLTDVDNWWHGFFSYLASGPPPRRLAELLALHESGVVAFLGAGMRVRLDERNGLFAGSGENFPGTVVSGTLIEARLPEPSVRRALDPLLRSLHGAGGLAEETVRTRAPERELPSGRIHTRLSDGRMLDARGEPHPRRFAVGPHTSARSGAAFTRPRTNAVPFRQNDAVAREMLALATDQRS